MTLPKAVDSLPPEILSAAWADLSDEKSPFMRKQGSLRALAALAHAAMVSKPGTLLSAYTHTHALAHTHTRALAHAHTLAHAEVVCVAHEPAGASSTQTAGKGCARGSLCVCVCVCVCVM